MPAYPFPLTLTFKIMSVSPIISVTDATGASVCYVKQKLFKLKEHVEVFTDETRSQVLCNINADRVIDFSASYTFTDAEGNAFGSVRRKGMRSLWRIHFEIYEGEQKLYDVVEESVMTRFMDGLLGEIPILGLLSAYVFQPKYNVIRASDGVQCYQLQKKPSLLDKKFELHELVESPDDITVLMSAITATLLERSSG